MRIRLKTFFWIRIHDFYDPRVSEGKTILYRYKRYGTISLC